jgi:hypothetical protein
MKVPAGITTISGQSGQSRNGLIYAGTSTPAATDVMMITIDKIKKPSIDQFFPENLQ